MRNQKPKFALWHRYGPGGHTTCGGHCIPEVVRRLSEYGEVHYFGLRSREPTPDLIRRHAVVHTLPVIYNRASTTNKFATTLLWYAALPFIGLRCRFMGVKVVYIDETLPLSAILARTFFGPNVVMTVMDFFLTIYFARHRWLQPLARLIEAIDFATWRRLPMIFTKVNFTHRFLIEHGAQPERLVTIYNPCDRTVYHPADKAAARRRFGLADDDLVVVHHGVLHPNKGNDLIIRALADLVPSHPQLRYLLIGTGPEMQKLRELTVSLDLVKHVVFAGWLAAETEVNEALNAGDIGLVMRIGQYTDNFHLTDTLAHEMACGLPIIAARLAGVGEAITDGETGFLFDPQNMGEFREKLELLMADASLRARFSVAALRRSAELCDPEIATRQTVEGILKVAGITQRGR